MHSILLSFNGSFPIAYSLTLTICQQQRTKSRKFIYADEIALVTQKRTYIKQKANSLEYYFNSQRLYFRMQNLKPCSKMGKVT